MTSPVACPRCPPRSPLRFALLLILYPISGQQSSLSTAERPTRGPANTSDHRVILQPGRWKIRDPENGGVYYAYHFFLGLNGTKSDYPECSQVTCRGLTDSRRDCNRLCSAGTWLDATVALKTATLEYNRAMASIDAAFGDVAALADTHIVGQSWSASDSSVSKLLSFSGEVTPTDPRVVDVMRHHRTLIGEAQNNGAEHPPGPVEPAATSVDTSAFSGLLETWKSGAFKLAVQLNALTFALHEARRRLLTCAQGIRRSDLTECESDFFAGFYTDTPVASRSLSSSWLVVVTKRETWRPVALSHWYMPFIDSSKGNRTCWLDRPMVSDTRDDYRVPPCDSRGICDSLELDDKTVSACEVNEGGELSLQCPVTCGSPCFGPICYRPQSDTYTRRTASGEVLDGEASLDLVWVSKSPRTLSKVYSLSDDDIDTSLASVRSRVARAFEMLQRGENVSRTITRMEVDARKCIDQVRTEAAARAIKRVDCERIIGHSQFMAAASVTLSALTAPLLIVLIIKLRSDRERRGVPASRSGATFL